MCSRQLGKQQESFWLLSVGLFKIPIDHSFLPSVPHSLAGQVQNTINYQPSKKPGSSTNEEHRLGGQVDQDLSP